MATGMTWVLAIVASIVVVVIIRIATRLRSVWWAVSLGLILGGALGNLTDRIFRSPGFFRGHVVDFVSVFGPERASTSRSSTWPTRPSPSAASCWW